MNFTLQKLFQSGTMMGVYLLAAFSLCYGQASSAPGNELTQIRMTVSRKVEIKGSRQTKEKTLPIGEVSILEANDILSVQFCEICRGRAFADLGYKRMIVFFVNPASVNRDLESGNGEIQRAIAEVKFEGELKPKKNQAKIYSEHKFKVPYKSIPLIFFVSGGDYKNDLRKTILAKQADVLKLSEQTTLISQLPAAVNFLLEVKSVLQTPAVSNPQILQSLAQRAQIFRFNQTNCFRQNFYRSDRDRLRCLVNNINADELTDEIQNFSFLSFGKLAGEETVARLRSKYAGLNIFFDAGVAAIEIIGRLFKKKPLQIQLGLLQTTDLQKSSAQNSPGNQNAENKLTGRSGGLMSLRQIPVNQQLNTERALIIAPLKWKEAEEIIQKKDLEAMEVLGLRRCLHQGKNSFWIDTESDVLRQETKSVRLSLQKKFDDKQLIEYSAQPVNRTDFGFTIEVNDSMWRKIKDWKEVVLKVSAEYGFDEFEKELNLQILPKANWQIIGNSNPVRKGEKTTLSLAPNTEKRDCLDKIVLTDEGKQKIQLSPIGEYFVNQNGIVKLNLNTQNLSKLQAGKITVEIFENGSQAPSGSADFKLIEK